MRFEHIPSVEIDNESIRLHDQRIFYRDMKSVRWTATVTQRYISIIPAGKGYEASLYIGASTVPNGNEIGIFPKHSWAGGLSKLAFNELAHLSQIVSRLSFFARVKPYEMMVKERGYFTFHDYQFHKSGDVFQNGIKQFNIKDEETKCYIEPFGVTVRPSKAGRSRLQQLTKKTYTIDLSANRDCFVFMLHKVCGLTFRGEILPTKIVPPEQLFYETILKFGAAMANADGKADASELRQLKSYFQIDAIGYLNVAYLFNSQLHEPEDIASILRPFEEAFSGALEVKETFLYGMALVALADGHLHPRESHLLLEASRYLKINKSAFNRILGSLGILREDDEQQSGRRQTGQSVKEKYLSTLGLNGECTVMEIKSAHRRLVKKYHPDALRSQGLPTSEVQIAEKMIREINHAYAELSKAF